MSLGTRIKALRKASRLTQQNLAEMADVSRIYIQALEGDRRTPSMKLLGVIAECLGVQPSDLVSSPPNQNQGRFQLDEFLLGNAGLEIWHRGRMLNSSELSFISKIVDAAVVQWEDDVDKRVRKSKKAEVKLKPSKALKTPRKYKKTK